MDEYFQMEQKQTYFSKLFIQFRKPVHDYIKVITGSHHIAEELVQEVFMRLWKSILSGTEIQNPEFYILQIARNQCYNYFEKVSRDIKLYRELKARMIKNPNEDPSNVEDDIEFRELHKIIQKAADTLSPQRRKVYDLSRIQGLSIEQIAIELHLSPNTVKNHLVDSLKQIREYYQAHHPDLAILLMAFTFLSHQYSQLF